MDLGYKLHYMTKDMRYFGWRGGHPIMPARVTVCLHEANPSRYWVRPFSAIQLLDRSSY